MPRLLRGYGVIITSYIKGDKDSIEEVNKLIIDNSRKVINDIISKELNKGNICKQLGYIDYVIHIVNVSGDCVYRKDVIIK